jgi:hypothetical protein
MTAIAFAALLLVAFANYTSRVRLQAEVQRLSAQVGPIDPADDPENAEAAKRILAKVKKHVAIPDDAQPTVAIIVDAEKLRPTNDFYANAKDGDSVIITPTYALLYDPDEDIIINVAPVQIESEAAAKTK